MIIGIDVGGTFTDIVAVDSTGKVVIGKVPSVPHDEGQGVLNALRNLDIPTYGVERLVHGTTVGTNAIIQRQGATIAFVTTYGFRDIMEIGRAKRMIPGTMFKPFFARPRPVVPRSFCFEIKERTLYDGQVRHQPSDKDVAQLCRQLKDAGVEAVAICFLHSYANPVNEERVGNLIANTLRSIPISLSAEVVPEYREFERFSTTVLNAYIQPLMERYLHGLDRTLVRSGYKSGVLTIASNGGVMTLETAVRFPVHSILSGPAGGVTQSVFQARQLGFKNIISCDMGGTSTDVCLAKAYSPVISTDNLVGGFPLKIAQIDINTVGAGGGSIAWSDVDGALRIGPHSAGADPGPAAYGRGGTQPTVTDANVLLNRASTKRLLGGTIRLRSELAEKAIAGLAAHFPQLTPHQLAEGIVRLAVVRMCGAIREISIQRGHDPREFVLVAFGGAGPMHATQVAEELGMHKVLIPRFPGNFSAVGMANCDLKHDFVKTRLSLLSELSEGDVAEEIAELNQRAAAQLAKECIVPEAMVFHPSLDMRYWGQAFELNVPIHGAHLSLDAIASDFHQRHQQSYGHSDPKGEIELVNYRLSAFGLVKKTQPSPINSSSTSLADAEIEKRNVFFHGLFQECPVYERDKLPAATALAGPAIIEEFGATTVVSPSWRTTVDAYGNLLLEHTP